MQGEIANLALCGIWSNIASISGPSQSIACIHSGTLYHEVCNLYINVCKFPHNALWLYTFYTFPYTCTKLHVQELAFVFICCIPLTGTSIFQKSWNSQCSSMFQILAKPLKWIKLQLKSILVPVFKVQNIL